MSATDLAATSASPDRAELWAEVKRLRKDGQSAAALPLLERLCADHPSDLRFLICLAEDLFGAGRDAEARAWLERARALDPADPRLAPLAARLRARSPTAGELADLEAARATLRRRLEGHAARGEAAALIAAYRSVVREDPAVVSEIEAWAPMVNAAGQALYAASGEAPGAWASAVIDEVRTRGIAIRRVEEAFSGPELLAELQQVVRTTEDWSVPGKRHFFKAVREAEVEASHPILRGALQSRLLEAAAGFYGLHARLASANIVQTRTDASPDRRCRSSEGWHRDPEDRPMFKTFVYLNDVLEIGHGPFQYVPQSRPGGRYAPLLSRFGRGVYDRSYDLRPDWDAMDQEVEAADIVTVLGKAGTVFFCDTSGFHRGGFCTSQDRYMCAYVYQRPGSQFPLYLASAAANEHAPLAERMALARD